MEVQYKNYKKIYNHNFYVKRNENTEYSANAIFNAVSKYINPQSIIDVGGGVGTFLKTAQKFWNIEMDQVALVEGDYIEESLLEVDKKCYIPYNLEKSLKIDRKYDLVISLEVAEHLSKTRAKTFCEDLTKIGDIILFSAAAKGQGGDNHINENRIGYWIDIFEQFGFKPFDVIRPIIQYEDNIPFWYRQNVLLYVKENTNIYEKIFNNYLWLPPLDMISYEMLELRDELIKSIENQYWHRIKRAVKTLLIKRK